MGIYKKSLPYLTIPPPKFVCKLHHFIYNLKQTSRNWNHKLTVELLLLGYSQSTDHFMFVKSFESFTIVLLVCVDDMILTSNNVSAMQHVKTHLHNKFRIKDLGLLRYFLGLEALQSCDGLILN